MKNRAVAALLMLAMMFGGIYIGGRRSLGNRYDKVAGAFENGVLDDGYSIANDLEEIKAQAYNLCTIAKKFLPEDNAEIKAAENARAALMSAVGISDKYVKNYQLYEAVVALYADLKAEASFTGSQADMAKIAYGEIESRNDTIKNDGYNAAAKDFNDIRNGFPTAFIAALCGIKSAEYFS
ncbi:MAG: LemA family protein [Eubacteriales bacterium]